MRVPCFYCGKESEKSLGAVNRATKKNAALFCNKICFGLNRRVEKTREQKREEKRQYDKDYRAKNRELLKSKKRQYFQKTYDPIKASEERKKNMSRHVEYCRRQEYKEWKKSYDSQYRAKKFYGEFWESFLLILQVNKEVDSRMSDYDVRVANGTINKQLQRRREYDRIISQRT